MFKKNFLFLILITLSFSAPLDGDKFLVNQPDGSKIPVIYFGDEFFVTAESPDGFTIVQNSEGWFTYAKLSADGAEYLPTDQIYTLKSRSAQNPSEKHLRINVESMRKKIDQGRKTLRQPSVKTVNSRFRKRRAAAETQFSSPDIDTITGLTVLIDFPDEKSNLTQTQIEDFVNKDGYTEFGNYGSIRDYFFDVSNGKWIYLNIVTEFYTTKNPKSYYDHNISWMDGSQKSEAITQAQEVMHEALEYLKSSGFDFSKISKNGSQSLGYDFRAVNFFYAGNANNGWGRGLWPHKSVLYTKKPYFSADNTRVWTYQISSIGTKLKIGTFIHESGHVLCGYPDLYPYDRSYKNVVQNYCHMSSSGKSNPVPFNPYFRYLMGWLELSNIDTLTEGREYSSEANSSHAYFSHSHGSEWYFIENRAKSGRSSNLSGEGLLIWHINESGSNSHPAKTEGVRLVEIVQADGYNHLANGGSPDTEDFFRENHNNWFSDATTPSAQWKDGSNSGIDIRNISPAGNIMTFSLGELDTSTFELTVENGSGDGLYEESDRIIIKAENRSGMQFDRWTGNTSYLEDSTLSETILIMPAENIRVTALYEDITDTDFVQFINLAEWTKVTDSMGSKIEITVDTLDDTVTAVKAFIERTEKTEEHSYPYVSLTARYNGNYESLSKIAVTYRTTKAMKMFLPQPSTSENGAIYYVKLPIADNWTTLSFNISQFIETEKTRNESQIELILSSLNGISFELAGNETTAQNGTFIMSSLKLYGLMGKNATPVNSRYYSETALKIVNINKNQIRFTAPKAGLFNISIYSAQGRLISTVNRECTFGLNSVEPGSHLAEGMKIISISGEGFNINKKAVF